MQCEAEGCEEPAVYRPVLLLYTAEGAEAIPATVELALCPQHAKELTLEMLLPTKEALAKMLAGFMIARDQVPVWDLTQLVFEPLGGSKPVGDA